MALYPLIHPVARYAQPGGCFDDEMTSLCYLFDGFDLEFLGVLPTAHGAS